MSFKTWGTLALGLLWLGPGCRPPEAQMSAKERQAQVRMVEPGAKPVAAAEPGGPGANLYFPSENLDLGVLVQGESGHGKFVIKNTGEADLALERAKGS